MSAASRRSRRLRSRTAEARGHRGAGLAAGSGPLPASRPRWIAERTFRHGDAPGPRVRAGVRLAGRLASRCSCPISCSRSTRPPPAPSRSGRAPPGAPVDGGRPGLLRGARRHPGAVRHRRRPRPAATRIAGRRRVPWRFQGEQDALRRHVLRQVCDFVCVASRAGRTAGPAHDGGQARSPGPVWSGRDATASLTPGYTPISRSRPTRSSTRSTAGEVTASRSVVSVAEARREVRTRAVTPAESRKSSRSCPPRGRAPRRQARRAARRAARRRW